MIEEQSSFFDKIDVIEEKDYETVVKHITCPVCEKEIPYTELEAANEA